MNIYLYRVKHKSICWKKPLNGRKLMTCSHSFYVQSYSLHTH